MKMNIKLLTTILICAMLIIGCPSTVDYKSQLLGEWDYLIAGSNTYHETHILMFDEKNICYRFDYIFRSYGSVGTEDYEYKFTHYYKYLASKDLLTFTDMTYDTNLKQFVITSEKTTDMKYNIDSSTGKLNFDSITYTKNNNSATIPIPTTTTSKIAGSTTITVASTTTTINQVTTTINSGSTTTNIVQTTAAVTTTTTVP